MRESNFHFPLHNKAAVCITSALYDRRAIDSTSPLPLLSTLTHLSYLTSTSPRIREILCSDGGLERLIAILRFTGKRMRQHRHLSRNSLIPPPALDPSHFLHFLDPSHPLTLTTSSSHPSKLVRRSSIFDRPEVHSSPFKSFLISPTPSQPLPSDLSSLNPDPLTVHQAAGFGFNKSQKQMLWTWSLAFQCLVNVGVRGSESIRTRVVEAGVVPVIISVLGGYLHEMERSRQQSEARERARKPILLTAPPASALLRHLSPTDLPRPPRPVLSPRTLLEPHARSVHNTPATLAPAPARAAQPTGFAASVANARPSPPRLSITGRRNSMTATLSENLATHLQPTTTQVNRNIHHAQLSARSDGSGTIAPPPVQAAVTPIPIHSSTDSVFRTGSISPSSVSSASSLETSQLIPGRANLVQHHLLRTVTLDTAQSSLASASGSGSEVEMDDSDVIQPTTTTGEDTRADDSDLVEGASATFEAHQSQSQNDVMMDLRESAEPGPSNLSGALGSSSGDSRRRPRRGTIKGNRRASIVQITPSAPPPTALAQLDDPPFSNSTDAGPTPMEGIETSSSSTRNSPHDSPNANSSSYNNHPTPRASSTRLAGPSVGDQQGRTDNLSNTSDVTMAGPSDPSPPVLNNLLDESPLRPALSLPSRPQPNNTEPQNLDGPQLQRIFSDTTETRPPTLFPGRPTAPPMIPITITHPPPNPGTPSSSTAPPTMCYRDEDVLLALQLLAYLSKYPHVRAYFHEPASRATLELTYGSMMEATRALARFVGRYKSDRHERERAKEAILALGGGPSRRSQPSSEGVASTPVPDGTTSPRHLPRPATSPVTRERMSRAEAYELAFSTREPIYTPQPPSDRDTLSTGTVRPHSTYTAPPPVTYYLADHDPGARTAHSSGPPSGPLPSSPQPINPLATNVFSYVERFTHRRPSHDRHTPAIPAEIQYWAGVIMRNACRKDEERGGIRQCANMQCGRWEAFPREFAKCRRCRKAKYCSKACQSKAWQLGHRFWCCNKSEEEPTGVSAAVTTETGETPAATNTATPASEDPVPGQPAALVDAAIARLRRRRSTATMVTRPGAIATPPDLEIPAPAPPAPVGPTTVEDETNRARQMMEAEAEADEPVIRL